ncbi:MAG: N-methyl-D-aspartate receptor NMDAR2C subunit [Rhizomicrobium sp.]
MTSHLLKLAWRQCFRDLGGSEPPPCARNELFARYSEPHRSYHTLQHLEECFGWLEQTRALAEHPGEVAFALFFHDAIYDTHASDNEQLSAELAAGVLDEYVRGDADPERVRALIMATKHDGVPVGPDACLLVDVDLSILGAAPERFDEYEQQVRREYAWVAPDAFRTGRRKILEQFLSRPSIYSAPFFAERLEAAARSNLKRSLGSGTVRI